MKATCSNCGKPLASAILDDEAREYDLCLNCEQRGNASADRISPESDQDPRPDVNTPKPQSFGELDREEAHRRMLRARGFDLEYDPHGFRLKRAGGPTSPSLGELSPYEIVRLAAEIDGETVPPEERIKCPNCGAVVPPNLLKCQWCSHDLEN